jgi:uncharacterized membrane protein
MQKGNGKRKMAFLAFAAVDMQGTGCWTNIVSTLLLLGIRSLNALLTHSIAVNTSYRSSMGITNPGIQALIALDLVIWRK